MSTLTFDQLRAANNARLPLFKNSKGLPAHSQPDGSDWSPLEWSGAVAGEVGEMANWTKKLRRGDVTLDDVVTEKGETLTVRQAVAKECADVVCYMDIIAKQFGVDLGAAVIAKFNEVSDRIGVAVKIEGE